MQTQNPKVNSGENYKCSWKDPCQCEDNQKQLLVNYDMMWHDGDIIHDPNNDGCGKWIRNWDAG